MLEKDRCKGAAIRSRAQHIVESERNTAYFLGLEKKKQSNMYISKVFHDQGNMVTHQEDILIIVQQYYSQLFSSSNLTDSGMSSLFSGVEKKLSSEDRQFCDVPFTVQEVETAIEGLNNNKSPGSDGLPGEFFKEFKQLLAPVLLKLFQNMQNIRASPRL